MSITNMTSPVAVPANKIDFGNEVQSGGQKGLSLSRFEAALDRAGMSAPDAVGQNQSAGTHSGPESFRVAQLFPTNITSAGPSTGPNSVDSITQSDRTRALRGLDLSKDISAADENTTGQGILDGLSRIRGAFDSHEAAVAGVSGSSLTNSTQLINLQLEVVKYSVLMDVTSKLTGKATQSLDTLMKGQ